jgi:hypothetical protein
MLGGDVTAHPFDCWFEFHAGIDQIAVFNKRISETRGNCLAAGYDYNDPSKLTHDAYVNPGSPADPADEYDINSGNNAAQCYDLTHQPVAIIAPPPSVYNSGVSTRLQIKGTSVYQLEHIVRWRT